MPVTELVSVQPAADFSSGHGYLAIRRGDTPGRVTIEHADPVIYIRREWIERAKAGLIPWAEWQHDCPWTMGGTLVLHGDRDLSYEVIGGCGPRVDAYLLSREGPPTGNRGTRA